MPTVGSVYDELLDMLAESANAKRVLSFRLSADKQKRLDLLLEKNRDGSITPEENAELDDFEHFEHVVRMLKARVRSKKRR